MEASERSFIFSVGTVVLSCSKSTRYGNKLEPFSLITRQTKNQIKMHITLAEKDPEISYQENLSLRGDAELFQDCLICSFGKFVCPLI